MTVTINCPPHQWDENGAVEGIVLAKYLKCPAKQWHATDGSIDSLKVANDRNKRDGLEIISFQKRRYMDTTLRNDPVTQTPAVTTTNKPVDPRIQRMRDSRGNSERFDKLASQVLEDVKTMTWSAALRKAGIPVGSAGRLRRRWEKMNLLPAVDKPLKITKETPKERDYDAEKVFIIADYEALSLKDFYTMQHLSSGKWTELKKRWGIKGKLLTNSQKDMVDKKAKTGTLDVKNAPLLPQIAIEFTFTATQDVVAKLLAIAFETLIQKELTK